MQFKFDKPSRNQKGRSGCLYGCAGLLLVVMLGLTAGYFYFRDRIGGVVEVENISNELTEKFGEAGDFTPGADGSIKPERIEIFLKIRDSLYNYRAAASSALTDISQAVAEDKAGEDKSIAEVFSIITSGLDLMPDIITYIKTKYRLQIENKMSRGEYIYIYTLAYYNYLGHEPGDGPKFMLVTDAQNDDEQEYKGEEAIIRRDKETRDKINGYFRKIFKNQIIAATLINDEKMVLKLRDETERLLKNPYALPWEENLPVEVEASFIKYRDRLDSLYSFELNPLEITMAE